MKTPFASGVLFRSLLVASFSSLVACSSVLQAVRISRSFPKQPAEIVADVSPEAGHETASLMDEAQRFDAEATYGFPRSMASGYRWVFITKKGVQNSPGLGYWVITPNK